MLLLLTMVWLLAKTNWTPRAALRLMSLPLMGYVLLTPTLHPWYLLMLLAFLPFLTPGSDEPAWFWIFVTPWLYLSGALIFSYLAYLDPRDFTEVEWARHLAWLPTLALLATACIVYFVRGKGVSCSQKGV
jgi:hypothetical protein